MKNYRALDRVIYCFSLNIACSVKDCAVALRSVYSQHLGFSSCSHVYRAGIYSTHITLRHHSRYTRNVQTEGKILIIVHVYSFAGCLQRGLRKNA